MKLTDNIISSNSKRFEAILDLRDYLNSTSFYFAEYSTLLINSDGSAEHQLSIIDLCRDSYKIISRHTATGVEVSTTSINNITDAEYRIKCIISDFNDGRKGNVVLP